MDVKFSSLYLGENMYGYLSLDIICSSKLAVFLKLHFRKTVRILKKIMSAYKYSYTFSCQIVAMVYMPPPPPVLAGDIWSPDHGLTNRARAKYLLDYNDRDRHGYTKMLKAVNHIRIHLNSIHRGQWNRNRHSAIKEHPPELAC